MKNEIKVVFKKSHSGYYKDVLVYASKFENFIEASPSNGVNLVIIPIDEFRAKYHWFDALWGRVNRWVGTEITYKDKPLGPVGLDRLLKVSKCVERYIKTDKRQFYCSTTEDEAGWGCRFIEGLIYKNRAPKRLTDVFWFDCGVFTSDNNWRVDKDKISTTLITEIDDKLLGSCPFFDLALIVDKINKLQGDIVISENSPWNIKYEEFYQGGIIIKRPIGVVYNEARARYSSTLSPFQLDLEEAEEAFLKELDKQTKLKLLIDELSHAYFEWKNNSYGHEVYLDPEKKKKRDWLNKLQNQIIIKMVKLKNILMNEN